MLNNVSIFKRLNISVIIAITFFISCLIGLLLVWGFWFLALGMCFIFLLVFYSRKTENFLLIWLFFTPFFATDRFAFLFVQGHPIITFDRAIIIGTTIILIIQILLRVRKFSRWNMIDSSMLLFTFIVVCSIVVLSKNKIYSFRYFFDSFAIPFLIYFLTKNLIVNETLFRRSLKILAWLALFLALTGIYEHVTGSDFAHTYSGIVERAGWRRVNGPYKMDTTFGVNIIICFYISFLIFLLEKRFFWKRIIEPVILILLLAAMIFNFYRGIWIAWFIGFLLWCILRKAFKPVHFFIGALLIIFAISGYESLKETLLFRSRITNLETIQSRLKKYDVALNEFKLSPVVGIGFRNENMIGEQHNTFLAFLSETGILGALILLLLLFAIYKQAIKYYRFSADQNSKEFAGIFICLLSSVLISWFGLNTGFDTDINKLLFFILGLLIGKCEMDQTAFGGSK